MFYIGKEYKDKSGETHTVLMHNLHGKFPIITKNKKGKMGKYTRDGLFYENKPSNLDLIESAQ